MWLSLVGCTGLLETGSSIPFVTSTAPPETSTVGPTGPQPEPQPTTPVADNVRNFTLAVWMAADNDLEPAVNYDLDDLEAAARDDLHIVVQVDGTPGFLPYWETTHRIEIVPDDAPGMVSSIVEDLGEVNTGDGPALADFLLWANEHYPAEHFALMMWSHGGGFWIVADDTSSDVIRIDDGELSQALDALVAVRGEKLDVIGFDACNMAQWETAYALREQVQYFAASQAWVGWEGYGYADAVAALPPDADGLDLANLLAESAMANGEHTHSVVDTSQLDALASAVDALASAYLDDPDGVARFRTVLDRAKGLDAYYEEFWLDLGSVADEASTDPNEEVVNGALSVRDTLDEVMASVYAVKSLNFASGLTIYADLTGVWLESYQRGPWADATAWDDLLVQASQ